ncbi:MAG: hypothetical protein IJP92_14620 [Lachnospiraceae bacterium]|nr:hypothetical protein [Lachnospiraceae bacterium]
MEFVQAQFSLKFEPRIRIRRDANAIEDFLNERYGPPQTIPMPDDFAAEAPRIILTSKYGHSQISFSQLSVDFTVGFDRDYRVDFGKTKHYITERLELVRGVLEQIGIADFYYCGITYNAHIDTNGLSTENYIREKISIPADQSAQLYEALQRTAIVIDDKLFYNEQIGTYKEFQNAGPPSLMTVNNSQLVSEGVNLMVDVNNRYEFMKSGSKTPIADYTGLISVFYSVIEKAIEKWR